MWRFAPDLPPDTPEVWQTCDGFHPDVNGVYRTGWVHGSGTAVTANTDFVVGRYVYDAAAYFEERIAVTCGSSSGPTAAQVFAGGTDRSGASTPRPSYNQGIAAYGNIVLISTALSGAIASRTISAAANFADVASTPGADILLVNPLNIVIGLRTDAGLDGWATSDVGDYTNWTTLEAASGNLRQTPGQITAGVILGNDVIAFKRHGVYRGTYVGGTLKWQWQLLHAEYGAWGPGLAITAEDRVYFMGEQGLMVYDGAQFSKVDQGISYTLADYMTNGTTIPTFTYNQQAAQMIFDSGSRMILFFAMGLPTTSPTVARTAVMDGQFYSYNPVSGAFGRQTRIADTGSDYFSAVVDGKIYQLGSAVDPVVELWNKTDDEFVTLSTDISASVTTYQPKIGTGKIGQRTGHTSVTRVIPRWTYSNGQGSNLSTATLKTAKCYAYNSILQVKTDVTATDVTLAGNQYWADYLKDAQYHQFDFLINAGACIDGVEIETVPAGKY